VDPFDARRVQAAYDAVAEDYTTAFAEDLAQLDVDRAVLDAAAASFPPGRPVVEVGCGPGQVSRYLQDRGVRCIGADLAMEMLRIARRAPGGHSPAMLIGADLRALPLRTGSCAGVVAFYAIQHLPRVDLAAGLDELGRVLVPGGLLVIAAHLGEGHVTFDEFLGHRIEPTGGTFFGEDELSGALGRARFVIEHRRTRGALPHEHPSERLYLIARRSG